MKHPIMHLQDMNSNNPIITSGLKPPNLVGINIVDPERTYDEPCDLDYEGAPGRIPRSRSWLCCPQGVEREGGALPCRYSSLPPVTVPPKPQEQLHVAALAALKSEVLELSARLQASARERDHLQSKLSEEQEERGRAQVRLEAMGAAHEGRLTELHCVIAELSRKLQQRQQTAIMEEDNEGDISEVESSSICEIEANDRTLGDITDNEQQDENCVQSLESPAELPQPELTTSVNHMSNQTHPSATHIAALQEEVLSLRQEVAHLHSQLASKQNGDSICNDCVDNSMCDRHYDTENSVKRSNTYTSEQDYEDTIPNDLSCRLNDSFIENNEKESDSERNDLQIQDIRHDKSSPVHNNFNDQIKINEKKDIDFNDDQKNEQQSQVRTHSTAKHIKTSSLVLQPVRSASPIHVHGGIGSLGRSGHGAPVAKMAERVRLRRTTEERHITGPDITNTGVCTTEVAEHLVSDFLTQSSLRESLGLCPTMGLTGSATTPAESIRLELELERANARLEHSRANCTVLALTLQESKAHCDRLALLCGRYESNAMALQVALNFSDRTVEAYDVLLALLESQMALMKSNEDDPIEQASARDGRRAAETVAKHLLARLQAEGGPLGASMGPWQDAKALYANSAVTSDPWSSADESRLRSLMSRLKAERAGVQNTVVILESPHAGEYEPRSRPQEIRRLDLETAVLMQELMSMREEKAELRSRVFASERDRASAELRLAALEAAHRAAQAALQHLQAQLADTEALLAIARQNKDRSSYSESEHAAGIERELVEALARESRLKSRLQGLAGSLEAAARTSEERNAQSQAVMTDLRQANLALTQSLERCKKKYQNRLRRLEQQMLGMAERHVAQVNVGLGYPVQVHGMSPTQGPETTL